ncbi:hypothetical protein OAF27_00065 [Verrucomicrobiales bacterium]|nr:hypothetical protein [Verrucomicrobiales bacterium]
MTPPPNPPGVAPQKKGLHPLAYVGIGCGGLLLIGVVAAGFAIAKGVGVAKQFMEDPTMAVAALVVQTSPDLELVKSDPDSGVLKVRVESTGETISIDRAQIESGKFSYTKVNADGTEEVVNIDFSGADDGEFSVTDGEGGTLFETGEALSDQIPAWVPPLPEASEVTGTFNMKVGTKQTGSFSMKTAQTPGEVIASYQPTLEESGFVVTTQGITQNGEATQTILNAKDESNGQMINLIIMPDKNGSSVQATYSSEE